MSESSHGLHASTDRWPATLFAVALAFSIFQVATAAYPLISTQVLRSVHVGFLLLVVFLSYPVVGHHRPWQPLAWLLGIAGMTTAAYQWYFEGDLIQRSGELISSDLIVGLLLIGLVFEAARRVMGVALPFICALFLAYGLLGQYLPVTLRTEATALTRLSTNCPSVPRGCMAPLPMFQPRTSTCSSSLGRFWSRRA